MWVKDRPNAEVRRFPAGTQQHNFFRHQRVCWRLEIRPRSLNRELLCKRKVCFIKNTERKERYQRYGEVRDLKKVWFSPADERIFSVQEKIWLFFFFFNFTTLVYLWVYPGSWRHLEVNVLKMRQQEIGCPLDLYVYTVSSQKLEWDATSQRSNGRQSPVVEMQK